MDSAVRIGSGEFTYEVEVGWEKLPAGYTWREAVAVAVDSRDRVYVFSRRDEPNVTVFDSDGTYVDSWGEGVFAGAHGLTIGPDDTIFCADNVGHTVRKCRLDGEVLMTLGEPGEPAPAFGGDPFNACTHVALDPETGDIYVADGYSNARVHKSSPDGSLLFSWGVPGTEPGEFNCVHNIATDKDGYVYVCDRENSRVQVFDSAGKLEAVWNNIHRPCAIFITERQQIFIGELGGGSAFNRYAPGIGPRLSVYNTSGERLARIGESGYGFEPGQFAAPHGIALDSKGDIYVAEVAWTGMSHYTTPTDGVRTLQKLVKASR